MHKRYYVLGIDSSEWREREDNVIVIIDYGMGNLGSIVNMLKKVGSRAVISSDREEIRRADKLILPGVGAFDAGMQRLTELQLIDILQEKATVEKIPVLGVCLGMQLLTRCSEEGQLPGLGWIDGETIRFRFDPKAENLKIPHMGWNTINQQKPNRLLAEMYPDPRFYFVHSYHVTCRSPEDVLATTNYGYDFVSMIEQGNILGAQFHPEKSHKFGMRLLKNFAEMA